MSVSLNDEQIHSGIVLRQGLYKTTMRPFLRLEYETKSGSIRTIYFYQTRYSIFNRRRLQPIHRYNKESYGGTSGSQKINKAIEWRKSLRLTDPGQLHFHEIVTKM